MQDLYDAHGIDKYYGFYFSGPDFNRELSQTYLPVGEVDLDLLLSSAADYSRGLKFQPIFGMIKELTLMDGQIRINSPSKVGREQFQAFILKRPDDVILGGPITFYINDCLLDFEFTKYDVNIVEV